METPPEWALCFMQNTRLNLYNQVLPALPLFKRDSGRLLMKEISRLLPFENKRLLFIL